MSSPPGPDLTVGGARALPDQVRLNLALAEERKSGRRHRLPLLQLQSLPKFAGTVLHELSHALSGAPDVSLGRVGSTATSRFRGSGL